MHSYIYVAIVTVLALLTYAWMGTRVSATRRKTGIRAPAVTGDPLLERTIRAHYNTLEWLPIFLPALWLFAIYVSDPYAALLGLVWIGGRALYLTGYAQAAEKRGRGFAVQFVAAAILWLGALGAIVWRIVQG